jgi:hypothetical protein
LTKSISALLMSSALLCTVLLAGCGGGGGGGSSSTGSGGGGGGGGGSSTPQTLILEGYVTDSTGAALGNGKVTETQAAVSATTAANGAFVLTLPSASSGTSVTLDVYNSSQQLELVVQETITAAAGGTQNIGDLSVGPPPPPPSPEATKS